MEIFMILAAVAALAVSGVLVATMMARSRRPELRLASEDALERDGDDALMRSLERPDPSPIDREATVLDPQAPGRAGGDREAR